MTEPTNGEQRLVAEPEATKSQPSDVVEPTTAPEATQDLVANSQTVGTEAAQKQHEDDAKFRAENPNEPLIRDANPEVGGESF